MTADTVMNIFAILACSISTLTIIESIRVALKVRRMRNDYLRTFSVIKTPFIYYTDGRPVPTLRDVYDDPFSAAIARCFRQFGF